MCEGLILFFAPLFHCLSSALTSRFHRIRRKKLIRALLDFLHWVFGSEDAAPIQLSDEVINEIIEHENETNFIKNFIMENDKEADEEVKLHAELFLLYCVGEYFDLDEMISVDPTFFDRMLWVLFKCSVVDIPQEQDVDLFIRNTIGNGEVDEKLYKSLTIAFVLKKAADHFADKYQPNLIAKYKELSSCYEKHAAQLLEKSRQISFTATMEKLDPSNSNRPSWCNICMHDIAYHGKFTEFLNHRTCVISASNRWDAMDENTGVKPSTARRAHVFAHLLFVALFTGMMLSMNRIEYHEKRDEESSTIINVLWTILRMFLLFWKVMFITQTVMTYENFSGSEVYLCIAFVTNILVLAILVIFDYYEAPWQLWSPVRVLYDITFLISYVLSTLILLRHFTADRFYGSVVRLLSKMSRMLLWFIVVFIVFWFTYAVTILSLTGEKISLRQVPWKVFENGAFEIFADFKEDMQEGKVARCEEKKIMSDGIECLIRSWLIPVSLLIYVLVCTIVLINIITSFLTSAYEELLQDCSPQSQANYEFYGRLLEYSRKPALPPPLTFIPFIRHRIARMKSSCLWKKNRTRKHIRCLESRDSDSGRGDEDQALRPISIDYPEEQEETGV